MKSPCGLSVVSLASDDLGSVSFPVSREKCVCTLRDRKKDEIWPLSKAICPLKAMMLSFMLYPAMLHSCWDRRGDDSIIC